MVGDTEYDECTAPHAVVLWPVVWQSRFMQGFECSQRVHFLKLERFLEDFWKLREELAPPTPSRGLSARSCGPGFTKMVYALGIMLWWGRLASEDALIIRVHQGLVFAETRGYTLSTEPYMLKSVWFLCSPDFRIPHLHNAHIAPKSPADL